MEREMVKEYSILLMEVFIRVLGNKIRCMEKVLCTILMDILPTTVGGIWTVSTAKEEYTTIIHGNCRHNSTTIT